MGGCFYLVFVNGTVNSYSGFSILAFPGCRRGWNHHSDSPNGDVLISHGGELVPYLQKEMCPWVGHLWIYSFTDFSVSSSELSGSAPCLAQGLRWDRSWSEPVWLFGYWFPTAETLPSDPKNDISASSGHLNPNYLFRGFINLKKKSLVYQIWEIAFTLDL